MEWDWGVEWAGSGWEGANEWIGRIIRAGGDGMDGMGMAWHGKRAGVDSQSDIRYRLGLWTTRPLDDRDHVPRCSCRETIDKPNKGEKESSSLDLGPCSCPRAILSLCFFFPPLSLLPCHQRLLTSAALQQYTVLIAQYLAK